MKKLCFPFGCGPEEHPDRATGLKGVIKGELRRWMTSIETLEKEGRKQSGKKPPAGDSSRDAVSGDSALSAAEAPGTQLKKVGLNRSYKHFKNMLWGRSGSEAGSNTTPSSAADSKSDEELRGRASLRARADSLQSAASGDSMVSVDTAMLRSKLLRPIHERMRQDTVDALNIVHGSQTDPHYQSIVALAAKMFKVPYAAIAIIDRQRVWMKAVHYKGAKLYEEPRETSFTAYMLLNEKPEVMVVEDTKEDGRFHDLVRRKKTKERIRFFAAAPMYASNGYQIGALKIMDNKPRKLDAGSFALLTNLAEMAMRGLEKEAFGTFTDIDHLPPAPARVDILQQDPRNIYVNESALDVKLISELADGRLVRVPSVRPSPREKLTLVRSRNMLQTGIMVCDAAAAGGAGVLFVNSIWTQLTGISERSACNKSLWQLFSVPGKDAAAMNKLMNEVVAAQKVLDIFARLKGQQDRGFFLSLKSASSDNLDVDMPMVGVPSFVEFSQRRNLCYFFVMVRSAKDMLGSTPQHRSPIVSAFELAASNEPWGNELVTPPPEHEPNASCDSSPVGGSGGLGIRRKSSVLLPYNDGLFSEVTLGPLLGRGGFGKVHRGLWRDRQIAVKILENFRQGPAPDEVDDLPEAALMASMQHPNVMRTFAHATRVKHHHAATRQFSDADGGHVLETWLLLEYCNKGSLQDATDRGWFRTDPSKAKGKPDMATILATALELAQGLEHLHSHGILHGDLSPGNVLLSDHPEAPHGFTVKIADFGLSRATASKTIKTQTFGTVTHMPPELLMDGKLTTAADVYAFGVLLWGMYSGVAPWQGMRRAQVLFKVTALGAKLPTPQGCPSFYKDLLERCMQREHRERPTFQELVHELRVLTSALQSGLDLQSITARTNGRRCISMPKEVASRRASMEEGVPPVRKARSFHRRPSFSQRTQLEVV